MDKQYRVQVTRYAHPQIPHFQRRGMTSEDMQFLQKEFKKDRPEIQSKLDKICAGKYKLDFKPCFTVMRGGGVVEVYAVFDEHKYATFLKMKIEEGKL